MKLTIYIVIAIILSIVLYVGILPAAISAKDTIAVLAGIAAALIYPVIVIRVFKRLLRKHLK